MSELLQALMETIEHLLIRSFIERGQRQSHLRDSVKLHSAMLQQVVHDINDRFEQLNAASREQDGRIHSVCTSRTQEVLDLNATEVRNLARRLTEASDKVKSLEVNIYVHLLFPASF